MQVGDLCCKARNANDEIYKNDYVIGPDWGIIAICGVGALIALGTITMLVMGILGATGTVAMAPIGARLMIGFSTAIILGLIGGAIRTCCCGR